MKAWVKQVVPLVAAYIISIVVVYGLSYLGLIEFNLYLVTLRTTGLLVVVNALAASTADGMDGKTCTMLKDIQNYMCVVSFFVINCIIGLAIFDGVIIKVIYWGIE